MTEGAAMTPTAGSYICDLGGLTEPRDVYPHFNPEKWLRQGVEMGYQVALTGTVLTITPYPDLSIESVGDWLDLLDLGNCSWGLAEHLDGGRGRFSGSGQRSRAV